jgi:hypothetical protein
MCASGCTGFRVWGFNSRVGGCVTRVTPFPHSPTTPSTPKPTCNPPDPQPPNQPPAPTCARPSGSASVSSANRFLSSPGTGSPPPSGVMRMSMMDTSPRRRPLGGGVRLYLVGGWVGGWVAGRVLHGGSNVFARGGGGVTPRTLPPPLLADSTAQPSPQIPPERPPNLPNVPKPPQSPQSPRPPPQKKQGPPHRPAATFCDPFSLRYCRMRSSTAASSSAREPSGFFGGWRFVGVLGRQRASQAAGARSGRWAPPPPETRTNPAIPRNPETRNPPTPGTQTHVTPKHPSTRNPPNPREPPQPPHKTRGPPPIPPPKKILPNPPKPPPTRLLHGDLNPPPVPRPHDLWQAVERHAVGEGGGGVEPVYQRAHVRGDGLAAGEGAGRVDGHHLFRGVVGV